MGSRKHLPSDKERQFFNTDMTQDGKVDIRNAYTKIPRLNAVTLSIKYLMEGRRRGLDLGCVVVPLYVLGILLSGLGLLFLAIGLLSSRTLLVFVVGISLIGLAFGIQKLAAKIKFPGQKTQEELSNWTDDQ